MTKLHKKETFHERPIDLLVGGTPCQSFSVAGLRKGLSDPRGNLALEYLRLADLKRPRWLIWENVPGVLSSNKGRDFGAFLGALGQLGYGFTYRVLDAQYFGVAQRRRRVFVVGYLGDWRPAAEVLFEPHSMQGHPAPRRETGTHVAALTSTGVGASGPDDNQAQAGHIITHPITARMTAFGEYETDGTASTIKARDHKDATDLIISIHENQRGEITTNPIAGTINTQVGLREHKDGDGTGLGIGEVGDPTYTLQAAHHHDVAHTLRAEGFDASEDGTGRGIPLVTVSLTTNPYADHEGRESLPVASTNAGGMVRQDYETETLIGVASTADNIYSVRHDAAQARTIQNLRMLQKATDQETYLYWGLGILASFWPQEVLRPEVYGEEFRHAPKPERGLVNVPLSRPQDGSPWSMYDLWKAGCGGCPPCGWQPSQQLAGELGSYLSELPYSPSPAERFMYCLWQSCEGEGTLREALSKIQKIRKPPHDQDQSTHKGLGVRRLTVEECESLQGFPRSYTAITYRGKPAADGPRYKAMGNSMCVNVMRWIGERIQMWEDGQL